jgi:hypothetical protein
MRPIKHKILPSLGKTLSQMAFHQIMHDLADQIITDLRQGEGKYPPPTIYLQHSRERGYDSERNRGWSLAPPFVPVSDLVILLHHQIVYGVKSPFHIWDS